MEDHLIKRNLRKKHGKIIAIYKSEARGDLIVLIFHKTPLARGQ